MDTFSISGRIVDLHNRRIFPGEVNVRDGVIVSISAKDKAEDRFILPGFVDSHVHIESSMLSPSRFAEMVVPRGTIAVVSDPHEIANVMGVPGVEFMISDGNTVPLKFFFGSPSSVPATCFESSGAVLDSEAVRLLLQREDIWFLSEVMNYPGVIHGDKDVLKKLEYANSLAKPIDGHAPGLSGADLEKYVSHNITTDHECSSLEEAEIKLSKGMKIQIREGSAARNFHALHSLFFKYPNQLMLCTDDSHPDEILNQGHIDRILRLGIGKYNINLFDILRSATIIPVQHYKLPVGLLREGDPADFIVVDNLENFSLLESYIDGKKVFDRTKGNLFTVQPGLTINRFREQALDVNELKLSMPESKTSVRVIDVRDGELLSSQYLWKPELGAGVRLEGSIKDDIIKLVVLSRYSNQKPALGFVKNLGIKRGAIGSSVAHDSHNLIVAGVDDESIALVINELIKSGGGIAAFDGENLNLLPLAVGGLMSNERGEYVAAKYQELNQLAKNMGSSLKAPFMTLSFLSLLVIPELKLSDKGLFDVSKFSFVPLFV